jgi:microcystin-dependent protein
MSEPYVGEIRMVGFNFAPQNWALCNGQTLSISQNEVLFNLIGTTYGGDGINTFNLPNLQGRIPFHQGSNGSSGSLVIGQISGSENVTLTTNQLPAHTHPLVAAQGVNSGTQPSPSGGLWAGSTLEQFSTETPADSMDPSAILASGGGQPHDNVPPFLVVNFIISLFGVFPSQN